MKKKTGLLIAIIAIIALLIIVGIITFLYLMTDVFKTNEQLFWKYISNSSQIAKMLSVDDVNSQKTWKDTHSYTAKGDLTIAVTKETGTQEIKLGTTAKHSQNTGRTYADVTLYKEEAEQLKVSYINSNDIYALYCKDIYEPYYIGFRNNVEELVEKFSTSGDTVTDFSNFNLVKILKALKEITLEEKKHLSDTYSNIIIENILEEKYTKTDKTSLYINNRNYETVGYQLQLNQEDLRQIMISILTKAKEDDKTIDIMNKVFVNEGDINNIIEQLINRIQQQNMKAMNLTICVYNINKKLTRIQINDNQGEELILDIDNSKENKEKVTLRVKGTKDVIITNDIQMEIEKQMLDSMIIYTTNIYDNQSGSQLTMNTSLGNIVDNKMENNSKITILNNDTTIETSYYNTIQVATEEVDIEELADTSAVVINNYPREQLQEFFKGIEKKIEQVIPDKIEQLNIKMAETQNRRYYFQGIAASIFTVMNANGAPQAIGTIGTMIMTAVNGKMLDIQENNQITTNPSDNTFNLMTEQEKQLFNQKYEMYGGEEVNGTIVKTLISNIANSNVNSGRVVSLKIIGDKIKKPDDWNEKGEVDNTKLLQLSNEIQMANKYTVSIEYNEEGIVNIITIMEK